MKYIVIPSVRNANYQDSNDNLYVIKQVGDNVVAVGPGVITTTDISAYTPLQSYIAEQASVLQRTKNKAITILESNLANTFEAGISIVGPTGTIILAATPDDTLTFTQAVALLTAAVANIPDPTSFNASLISVILGRGITDVNGVSHDMTVSQFMQLVTVYGQQVATMEAALIAEIAQVDACTTVAQVKALVP